MTMSKTIALAVACASIMTMAEAQPSGSVGGGVSTGTHGTNTGTSSGVTGGGSVATPPASTGAGVSGGASTTQPSVDINQAQQPGVGVNSGASGSGSVRPLGR